MKLALEMQSEKGSQLQGKGPTCRDESPRPEAESTEKGCGEQERGSELSKICKRNRRQFAISPLKGSRPKMSAVTPSLNTRVVSCGCSAPLQSITTARETGSALGLLPDPSTRLLSSPCIHSTSCLSSQHLISRPHSSGCGHVYGSP